MTYQATKLEPCPFCGASLVHKQPRQGDDYHEHPRNECILAGDYFIADPLTILSAPDATTAWNRRALPANQSEDVSLKTAGSLQQRVEPWLLACFGPAIAGDTVERNHRFLEEALELVQACGCTASEAHQLVDYTFGRPIGEKAQEAGGVMITLAALCRAQGIDMHEQGEVELARIWTMVEKIRAKQAAKPKHSPLPEVAALPPQAKAEPAGVSDEQAGALWDGFIAFIQLKHGYAEVKNVMGGTAQLRRDFIAANARAILSAAPSTGVRKDEGGQQ